MPILTIFIVIIIVGLLLYLVNTYLPLDAKVKSILNIVVIVVLVIWLLKAFGVFAMLSGVRV